MSHYVTVELKMQGEPEAIVRALCEMESRAHGRCFRRDEIEVHAERQPVRGFEDSVRPQHAHIIIRRQHVGGASNDLGLERKADGSWTMHVSDFDRGLQNDRHYGEAWQKRLLSKWAVQKVGLEAERRGYQWNVQYQNDETTGKKYAYVSVTR